MQIDLYMCTYGISGVRLVGYMFSPKIAATLSGILTPT